MENPRSPFVSTILGPTSRVEAMEFQGIDLLLLTHLLRSLLLPFSLCGQYQWYQVGKHLFVTTNDLSSDFDFSKYFGDNYLCWAE